jgi:hypothetical protein
MKRIAPACRCALVLLLAACQSQTTATISGQLVAGRSSALTIGLGSPTSRAITHVMAVDPESASPNRVLAPVQKDGHFALEVNFGHPYVLVFIDASAVGADMVVAVFRARTLDTLVPLNQGEVNLGQVTPHDGTATTSLPYAELLAQLGLSADGAAYLGAIDDLSLRYANPDIDGDGVIDLEQPGHTFQLDFHLRAQMLSGDDGHLLRVSDLTDRFLTDSGPAAARAAFNLASIYAIYPASYDGTRYIGDRGGLANGAVFAAISADGSPAAPSSSFSPLQFGDRAGWGPDYDWARSPSLELPGAGGAPVTLAFTLGGTGHTLTFANVVTRTRASLAADSTPVPFLNLRTGPGGEIASVDYRWLKGSPGGGWVPCTAEELALVVGDAGGFAGLSHGSKDNRVELVIPRQPAGTLAWTGGRTTPAEICSMAVSYDDKLGLRLFVGGVDPSEGTPACY